MARETMGQTDARLTKNATKRFPTPRYPRVQIGSRPAAAGRTQISGAGNQYPNKKS